MATITTPTDNRVAAKPDGRWVKLSSAEFEDRCGGNAGLHRAAPPPRAAFGANPK
jgi:hypothetical protein